MGTAQENAKGTSKSPTDYFLSLVSSPETNKMIATVNVFSMMILNRWASDLEKLSQIKAQSILTPKQYKIVERSVCGENMRLEIDYECFNIQLSEELSKRSQAEKYLQESEMWYLAYCLAESAAACHRLNKPVGDLRPENILLNSSGKLRILSKWSAPTREDPFGDPQKKNSLYSPEELQMIKKGYKQYQLDYIVSESFSIGMTLLSAGAIHHLGQCYDYTKSELNMVEFNRMLTFWHQNQFYSELLHHSISYSKQLKNIVINLLELQPERRMTSLQLYDLLKQHKEAIMAQQPFELQMSRVSSPKKRSLPKNDILSEGIHILRSRKRSEKIGSSIKSSVDNSKVQVSNFQPNLNMQFSFKQPPNFNGSHKNNIEESSSPKRKKKLNTVLYLSKQEGEQFK